MKMLAENIYLSFFCTLSYGNTQLLQEEYQIYKLPMKNKILNSCSLAVKNSNCKVILCMYFLAAALAPIK